MKLDLSQLRLQKEIDRTKALHVLHFCFFYLSFFIHRVQTGGWIGLILLTPLIFWFYHLYYQTLKELYYTYWSFSLFMIAYFLFTVISGDLSSSVFYLRFIGLLFLAAQMWILYNPIYYPIVSWWEYDFRYRDDVKVMVKLPNEKEVEGRLTDIRKEAACLCLFDDVRVGEEVLITSIDGLSLRKFRLKIMSKRQTLFGRPLDYGGKFLLGDSDERKDFNQFYDFWKNDRKDKMRLKFGAQ